MSQTSNADDRYARGLAVRRAVLGDAYVEKSLQNADDFVGPFLEIATEYCWGTVWTREGLSRRERSLINIGMLSALNRGAELKIHVKGALRNGCTKEQIREALIQAAIYCGVPTGAESFRIAREALAEFAAESGESAAAP